MCCIPGLEDKHKVPTLPELVYAFSAIIIKIQEGVCVCSRQEADSTMCNGKVKEPKSQNVFEKEQS